MSNTADNEKVYVSIRYITPETAEFERTPGGFMSMRLKGAVLEEVKEEKEKLEMEEKKLKEGAEDLGETKEKKDDEAPQEIGFYPRVNLIRSFPLSNINEYISVRDTENVEIAMIRRVSNFDKETNILFQEQLERRYFFPIIIKINSIKDEFGYTYWDVETNAGHSMFTVRGTYNNIYYLDSNRINITDVDGNRYEIDNYAKLDEKSKKHIAVHI